MKLEKAGDSEHTLLWLADKATVCFDRWKVKLGLYYFGKIFVCGGNTRKLLRFAWNTSGCLQIPVGKKGNKLNLFISLKIRHIDEWYSNSKKEH